MLFGLYAGNSSSNLLGALTDATMRVCETPYMHLSAAAGNSLSRLAVLLPGCGEFPRDRLLRLLAGVEVDLGRA